MKELHRVNKHNENLLKFTLTDAMIHELGWHKGLRLNGEITDDKSFVLYAEDTVFHAMLCNQPTYNLVTFPNLVNINKPVMAQMESVNGVLHIRFLRQEEL